MRPALPAPGGEAVREARFQQAKSRLEAFLRRLDEDDPWFVLGVPPGASLETVRARFRELALRHHPDRGGDPVQMQRITRAFDTIRGGGGRPSAGPEELKPPAVDDDSAQVFAVARRTRAR
ncbi:hypothetical protein AKJ08_0187 [Vulgatibacter incomptus]|uniref:J domain-containing protein n=1 Tax=Vulgatibacter incomptus TaxID=1391653 RepID=A0A0K1P8F6_9BACT|nr:hypothetical protein AKJ08_0187 [Vulgatibacter incomptus]